MVFVERAGQRGGQTFFSQRSNLPYHEATRSFGPDLVTETNRMARLHILPVELHQPSGAGLLRERARLVEPGSAQPTIDPHRIHA